MKPANEFWEKSLYNKYMVHLMERWFKLLATSCSIQCGSLKGTPAIVMLELMRISSKTSKYGQRYVEPNQVTSQQCTFTFRCKISRCLWVDHCSSDAGSKTRGCLGLLVYLHVMKQMLFMVISLQVLPMLPGILNDASCWISLLLLIPIACRDIPL